MKTSDLPRTVYDEATLEKVKKLGFTEEEAIGFLHSLNSFFGPQEPPKKKSKMRVIR
jgi:hypothetical protein